MMNDDYLPIIQSIIHGTDQTSHHLNFNLLKDKDDDILLLPYHYLLKNPGKDIRSRLIDAFNHWFKVPQETLSKIKDIVQMLHDASLLIDDIEDDSILRRGKPVAHKIFGVPLTLNCGNYVYFKAMKKVQSLGSEPLDIFIDELCNLHKGQGLDIYYRDAQVCPSFEQYFSMIKHKTGGLFRLTVRLMLQFIPPSDNDDDNDNHLSSNNRSFIELAELLGIHFQIRDDYINLTNLKYADAKSFCEDITEGKYSFPIMYCLTQSTNSLASSELKSILRQKSMSLDVKRYAQTILQECGAFEYTLNVLGQIEAEIKTQVKAFGGNKALEELIELLKVSKENESNHNHKA